MIIEACHTKDLVKSEAIVFLCSQEEITRERKAYAEALSSYVKVICLDDEKESLSLKINRIEESGYKVILVLYPDAYITSIPYDITQLTVPTACFQIDTYSHTDSRIQQSMLFDYAFVFHPGYEQTFTEKGHPNAVLIPHAVEGHLFPAYKKERKYEIGWVGRLDGKLYQQRKAQVTAIQQKYQTNDINRFYNQEELIEIYANSKIGVNISRDDYMEDANLRCFEIMAGGALLITMDPTELTALGFIAGRHFVTYKNKEELLDKIDYYLAHEEERHEIAFAAYQYVNAHHTYFNRAESILATLKRREEALYGAPARLWHAKQVTELYFNYATSQHKWSKALQSGSQLMRMSYRKTFWVGLKLLKVIFVEIKLLF